MWRRFEHADPLTPLRYVRRKETTWTHHDRLATHRIRDVAAEHPNAILVAIDPDNDVAMRAPTLADGIVCCPCTRPAFNRTIPAHEIADLRRGLVDAISPELRAIAFRPPL